jgi:rhamnose utilization protein RhaD (predicted bifunctional aldolase and dehydrogenase)/NAD(P)-dependent dehydrogenase (short-subunit alcohol dehydrogenase family)
MSSHPWPEFDQSEDSLSVLVKLSRFYGRDPSFVLAGGGNTSFKDERVLHIKASGHALSEIGPDGFVQMDRGRLRVLEDADLGDDPEAREAAYKKALMESRLHPESGLRPSVECYLHHLIPGAYVCHTHSTLANMLTCTDRGEELCREWFGDSVLWVPYVDPGFTLGRYLQELLADHKQRTGRSEPDAILMQNHGLIVAGDTPDEIRQRTDRVLGVIEKQLPDEWLTAAYAPDSGADADEQRELLNRIMPAVRAALAQGSVLPVVRFDDSHAARVFACSAHARDVAEAGPLSPDQIVYCTSFPLWIDDPARMAAEDGPTALISELQIHKERRGVYPRVICLRGLGLLTIGPNPKDAGTVLEVYLDSVKVMAGAKLFGGVHYLTDRQRTFIENWEVESYRRKVHADKAAAGGMGRVHGKVAVVTGGAQGFGREIAVRLAAQGAFVAVADINADGVKQAAEELCSEHGAERVLGVAMNVTAADSVSAGMHAVIRAFGGIDILISNAGVLRAGSVKDLPERDFDFVTSVNYKGYFVCVQKAAPLMAMTHEVAPHILTDIIQINSKSGLEGSNKNGAYAGSKFGGVGLTQSFALELIEDGIKVNSICPGNFFDGPLWSDPDNGLFVQYLRTGKVPGAKEVSDVRRFYEQKVPMGRGCEADDVFRAIVYLVEQQYETGQALPVTGGQVMLH